MAIIERTHLAIIRAVDRQGSLTAAAEADSASTASSLELTMRAHATPATTNAAIIRSSTATSQNDCTAAMERES